MEPELVAQAQAGDPGAIHDLMSKVREVSYHYVRRRLISYAGGHELVEDVTQEVCMAVLTALETYEDTGLPFLHLVRRICGFKVVDAQRVVGRSPVTYTDDLPEDHNRRVVRTPEDIALARDEVRAAEALLNRLSPRHAMVLRMHAQEATSEEMGRALGTNMNAARVAQHRARKALRALIDNETDRRFAARVRED